MYETGAIFFPVSHVKKEAQDLMPGHRTRHLQNQHSDSGGLAPESMVSNPNALLGRVSEDVVSGAHVRTSEVVKPLKSM